MSLNELSERVGVSNVNFSKLKTGKKNDIRLMRAAKSGSFLAGFLVYLREKGADEAGLPEVHCIFRGDSV